MKKTSLLLALLGSCSLLTAAVTFDGEIERTVRKYGAPANVPSNSLDYLAKLGNLDRKQVVERLVEAWGPRRGPLYTQYRLDPYGMADGMQAGYYSDYNYQLPDPQGLHAEEVDFRRMRQKADLWERTHSLGTSRPSAKVWPPNEVARIESDRAAHHSRKAWRKVHRHNWRLDRDHRRDYRRDNRGYYGYGYGGYGYGAPGYYGSHAGYYGRSRGWNHGYGNYAHAGWNGAWGRPWTYAGDPYWADNSSYPKRRNHRRRRRSRRWRDDYRQASWYPGYRGVGYGHGYAYGNGYGYGHGYAPYDSYLANARWRGSRYVNTRDRDAALSRWYRAKTGVRLD